MIKVNAVFMYGDDVDEIVNNTELKSGIAIIDGQDIRCAYSVNSCRTYGKHTVIEFKSGGEMRITESVNTLFTLMNKAKNMVIHAN